METLKAAEFGELGNEPGHTLLYLWRSIFSTERGVWKDFSSHPGKVQTKPEFPGATIEFQLLDIILIRITV